MKKKNISNILKAKFHPITLRNKVKPTFKYCIQVVLKQQQALKRKRKFRQKNETKQNKTKKRKKIETYPWKCTPK